jgi:hypothetical protein
VDFGTLVECAGQRLGRQAATAFVQMTAWSVVTLRSSERELPCCDLLSGYSRNRSFLPCRLSSRRKSPRCPKRSPPSSTCCRASRAWVLVEPGGVGLLTCNCFARCAVKRRIFETAAEADFQETGAGCVNSENIFGSPSGGSEWNYYNA